MLILSERPHFATLERKFNHNTFTVQCNIKSRKPTSYGSKPVSSHVAAGSVVHRLGWVGVYAGVGVRVRLVWGWVG